MFLVQNYISSKKEFSMNRYENLKFKNFYYFLLFFSRFYTNFLTWVILALYLMFSSIYRGLKHGAKN